MALDTRFPAAMTGYASSQAPAWELALTKILNLMTVARRAGMQSRYSAPRVEDQLRTKMKSTRTQDAACPVLHSHIASESEETGLFRPTGNWFQVAVVDRP